MRKLIAILLLACAISADAAFDNFLDNLYQLYPAGCAVNVEDLDIHPGWRETIADGIIPVDNPFSTDEPLDARVQIERVGCAEPDRSLLLISFEVLDNADGVDDVGLLPAVYFDGRVRAPLRLATVPNTWGESNLSSSLPEGQRLTFFLDQYNPLFPVFDPGLSLNPTDLNEPFTLTFEPGLSAPQSQVLIPAYEEILRPTIFPFNGRYSGVWVAEGASDQGFVISFSESPVFAEDEGFVFFSWYTFDAEGQNLWLVGSSLFTHGDGGVTMGLERVTGGVFAGEATATREPAGNIQLIARNCTSLELTYDLGGIGLGQGTLILRRSFKTETMGYVCMDEETRAATPN